MATLDRTVVGLFDTSEHAEQAVRGLQTKGFARDNIGIAVQDREQAAALGDAGNVTATGESAGAGALTGTAVGGLLGLLVGLGTITVPGIGAVATAGTLATTLGSTALGAGIGAAAGGLIGALVGMGIPEDDAHVYAEGLKRGGVLVSVTTRDEQQADAAVQTLRQFNAVDIDKRRDEYRTSGWKGYEI
ncbi:MAG TPA: general stress protein [Herpetosiphonaceae bacterium]